MNRCHLWKRKKIISLIMFRFRKPKTSFPPVVFRWKYCGFTWNTAEENRHLTKLHSCKLLGSWRQVYLFHYEDRVVLYWCHFRMLRAFFKIYLKSSTVHYSALCFSQQNYLESIRPTSQSIIRLPTNKRKRKSDKMYFFLHLPRHQESKFAHAFVSKQS